MLNLIPTPKFAEISETKTLNVKSIVINETDINRDVIDDFYAFLSKINIQNGNGSQIEFLDDESLDNEEYRLEISDKIRIYSNSLGGKIFCIANAETNPFSTRRKCALSHNQGQAGTRNQRIYA
jgi:hypothetical protein